MFLRKQVTTSHGIVADFWTLTRGDFTFDPVTQLCCCRATMQLFVSQAICMEGHAPIDACQISLVGIPVALFDSGATALITQYLTTSVLDANGVEGKAFPTTFSGIVTFVDAEVVTIVPA